MCEGRAGLRDLASTLCCPTQRGGAVPSLAGSTPDQGAAREGLTGHPMANAARVHPVLPATPYTLHTRVIYKALSSRNGSQRFICIFFLCLSHTSSPLELKPSAPCTVSTSQQQVVPRGAPLGRGSAFHRGHMLIPLPSAAFPVDGGRALCQRQPRQT